MRFRRLHRGRPRGYYLRTMYRERDAGAGLIFVASRADKRCSRNTIKVPHAQGGLADAAGFSTSPEPGVAAWVFPPLSPPSAKLRRKLVGPRTNAHCGLSSEPVSFTSSTFESGVSTAPTTDLRMLPLS